MKRVARLFLALGLVALLVASPAAAAAGSAPAAKPSDQSPGAPLAAAVSTVTGIAISPLLGTAGYGAYQWMKAEEGTRTKLPWFAQPQFWIPAFLLLGVGALKDSFGTVFPPGLKKPLDVLETLENKCSGLVAAGAVVPLTMDTMGKLLFSAHGAEGSLAAAGLATLPLGTADFSGLLNLLTVPFGVAVFAAVWLASHAINVLILLSPWGAIDAALKGARVGLLGLLTLTSTLDPRIGALLSLVVIVIAFLVAGWAFRLTVFGSVFCWDFLTGRRRSFRVEAGEHRVFSGAAFAGLPVRTYGRLTRGGGGLEFTYRSWPWLPARTVPVPAPAASLAVGRGLFFSKVTSGDAGTVLLLPPRYRSHEEALASHYAFGGGVREAGLLRAWSALRELFGRRPAAG